MSAKDAMAAMLDELMGPKRNIELGKDTKVSFDDPDICPYYLVGFCPHDMFTNTKADLGPCSLVHDDNLRRMYPTSAENGRLGFERKLLRFLIKCEDENQRRIKKNKDKLAGIDDQGKKKNDDEKARIEREISDVDDEIKIAIKDAERAGNDGMVAKCQEFVDKSEELEKKKAALTEKLEKMTTNPVPHHPLLDELQAKPMEVCEICGSMLIINDAQQRVEEHLTGKMHTGFQKIRSSIEDLKDRVKKYEEEEDQKRERRSNGDHRRRSPSRDRKRRSRSRSPARRGSDNRDRDRRDRRDDRDRKDDRERRHRDRDRDHHRSYRR